MTRKRLSKQVGGLEVQVPLVRIRYKTFRINFKAKNIKNVSLKQIERDVIILSTTG